MSYVIVGTGGFIGIGRHDVAIPVSQIQDKAGKLVMMGGSKDLIKAMPRFAYATDTTRRDQFVAAAEMEKKVGAANADAKTKINQEMAAIQIDLKSVEGKLSAMKKATVCQLERVRS